MLEPYSYITANPGKEIRGKLIESFNYWLNVPKDKLAVINRVVGLLHNGSLLYVFSLCRTPVSADSSPVYRIDDIEDDSQLRRGIPGWSRLAVTPERHY